MPQQQGEVEYGHSGSHPELEQFPSRLEEAINGRSVRTFARTSGVSETGLRKYLDGKSTPNLERLISIAKASAVTVQWLATGTGPKHPGDADPDAFSEETPMERYKRSEAAFKAVLEAVGWDAPVLIREAVRTSMYAHGLTVDGAIYILDMCRKQQEAE